MTIDAVKRKLCFHCGTPPSAQALQLKDERGRLVAALDDEARKLGFYSPRDGWTLHIVDTDPTSLSGARARWWQNVCRRRACVQLQCPTAGGG